MTHRYYNLIDASIELDVSGLEAKLDELENFDASNLEERLSSLESLNTCNVDVNDLADVPNRVDVLESTVEGFADLDSRIGEIERNLGEWRATDLASLGERIEALERAQSTSANFFALAGKMIALLLNGARS